MKKHLQRIKAARIFQGLSEEDFNQLLILLDSQLKYYRKGQVIFKQGRRIHRLGLLLEGRIEIFQTDAWNQLQKLQTIKVGELFGEYYACTPFSVSNITLQANTACAILWIDLNEMIQNLQQNHIYAAVFKNMIEDFAIKNFSLVQTLQHRSKKTVKERIMSFLSEQAELNQSLEFCITMDRQQLADYLQCDRSVLCTQLTNLKKEKKIMYTGNQFKILQ